MHGRESYGDRRKIMGAPPGWGPNWKENQEKERFADLQHEAEKAQRKVKEEKRGLEILANGDLVKHRDSNEIAVIVEAGYRSFVDVLTGEGVCRWNRDRIEIIDKNS